MKRRLALSFVSCFLLFSSCTEQQPEAEESLLVQHEPFLHQSPEGTTYLSWIEEVDTTKVAFKFASLDSDQSWNEPNLLLEGDDWFINWADYPHLQVNSQSSLGHVLKKSASGAYTYDVNMILETNGQTKQFVVHDDKIEAEHGFVSITTTPEEDYFVTWLDGRNTVEDEAGNRGPMSIRAAWIGQDGTKHREDLLDNSICDCCQSHAYYGSNGPTVVYRDRSDQEVRDIYLTTYKDSAWSEPINVSMDDWEIAGCPVNGPQIVGTDSWEAVAWFNGKDQINEVKLRFGTNNWQTQTDAIKINNKESLGRIDMEVLDDQNTLVCWMELASPEIAQIMVRKVGRDGSLSDPIELATNKNSRKAGFPQIIIDGQSLILAYTDLKNGGSTITTETFDLNTLF